MKYFLLFITSLISFHAFAQERFFYGRVVDQKKNGIPFCIVEAKDRYEGVYCDEQGVFSFYANTDSIKVLMFYVIGYLKKEISVQNLANDSIIIELQEQPINLKEITIFPKKESRKKILGKKRLKYNGDGYSKYGNESAIFLHAEPNKNRFLNEVFIFITSKGVPNTKFRIHIYEKDSITHLPGKELTDSNLIVNAITGNEWVKADLSSRRISIKDGIFISVEWISGYGNNQTKMALIQHDDIIATYNGQVLGLTSHYGLQSLSYYRTGFNNKWSFSDPMKYSFKVYRFLNPMIYCTYRYIK